MATSFRRMFQRRRTLAQWAAENPTLGPGEIGVTTGTGSSAPGFKIGDGTTAWNDLDIEIPGVIRTPTPFQYPSAPDMGRIRFGGIEGEARFVGAAGMYSPTATDVITDDVHRLSLPDAATTNVYMTIEIEEWWLKDRLNIGFEWCNDSAGTGNVRFQYVVKEINIATETLAAGTVVVSRTDTIAAPSAGFSTTAVISVPGTDHIQPAPGILGSFYSIRITRLGSDALDTVTGPVGIIAVSWGRSDV